MSRKTGFETKFKVAMRNARRDTLIEKEKDRVYTKPRDTNGAAEMARRVRQMNKTVVGGSQK